MITASLDHYTDGATRIDPLTFWLRAEARIEETVNS
jgi:hypothetical protein